MQASQAGNTNYNAATSVSRSFTVTPAALTVTANGLSKVYGAAPNPTLTVSYTGFVNGETASVLSGSPSLSATTTSSTVAGGPYPITVTVGSLSAANYTLNYVNGTLAVTAAALAVTADNQTRAYGATNPTLTFTVSGFVNSETTNVLSGDPSVTTTATTNSSVVGGPASSSPRPGR